MKKQYIKPSVKVVSLGRDLPTLMAQSGRPGFIAPKGYHDGYVPGGRAKDGFVFTSMPEEGYDDGADGSEGGWSSSPWE